MLLDPYVSRLRDQLTAAAAAGGEDTREAAERLSSALDSAVRLTLLEALAAAADEITQELAPGSVAVRLRGRDPEFTVTTSPTDAAGPADDATEAPRSVPGTAIEGGADPVEGSDAVARINLRLPEQLKARVERAADRAGLSINSWLVRAASAAVERDARPGSHADAPHTRRGGTRVTGWVR